jgi:hypothetical protein
MSRLLTLLCSIGSTMQWALYRPGAGLRGIEGRLSEAAGNEAVNPFQPYFLVYIRSDAEVRYNFTAPKQILEMFRALSQGKTEPYAKLCELFDAETQNGQDMARYSALLDKAVVAIATQFNRKNAGTLFSGRGGKLTDAGKQVRDSNDFDLITWLVIKGPD